MLHSFTKIGLSIVAAGVCATSVPAAADDVAVRGKSDSQAARMLKSPRLQSRVNQLIADATPKLSSLRTYVARQSGMTYHKRLALTAILTTEYAIAFARKDLTGESGIAEVIDEVRRKDYLWKVQGKWFTDYPVAPLTNVHVILDRTLEAIATDSRAINSSVFDPMATQASHIAQTGSNLTLKGKPVFPYSFIWFQPLEEIEEKYDSRSSKLFSLIGGSHATPHSLAKESGLLDKWATIGLDERADTATKKDLMFSSLFGHTNVGWIGERFPDFNDVEYHYVKYDVSHTKAMAYVYRFFHNMARAHSESLPRHVRTIYQLVNEPFFSIDDGKWNTQPLSKYGMADFQNWLRAKYGTIEQLNEVWGSSWKSFDKVAVETPIKKAKRGTPVWLDIMRFNMVRITNFFQTASDQIHAGDPNALSTIKLMGWTFFNDDHSHGLDMEALCHVQDVLGADLDYTTNSSQLPWRDVDDRFLCSNWAKQAMFYDFCQSVAPGKPVFDSEFHALASAQAHDPAPSEVWVRAGLWAMHVTGVDGAIHWVWYRNGDGTTRTRSYDSRCHDFSDDPADLFAFATTMHEINDLAEVVAAFQEIEARVYIYYSEDAAIQDSKYMGRVRDIYRDIYYSGVRPGFVTTSMLERDGAPDGLLIVPELSFVSDVDLERLNRAMATTETIYIGTSFATKTAEGNPRDAARLPTAVTQAETLDLDRINPLAPSFIKVSSRAGVPGVLYRTISHHGKRYVFCLNQLTKAATIQLDATNVQEIKDGRLNQCESRFQLKPGHMKLLMLD